MADEGTTFEEMVAAEEAGETTATEEQTTTEETTEETGADSEDTEQETEAEGDDSEETGEEGGESEDSSFFDNLGDAGAYLREKYGSKAAALQGMQHLISRVGRKETEERIGQALLERLGQDRVAAILRGEEPEKQSGKQEQKDDSPLPGSWEEMLYAQQVLEDDKASAEMRERARKQISSFQRRLYELAKDPTSFLSKSDHLKKLTEELEALKKSTSETSLQSVDDNFMAAHQSELVATDGSSWTPLGRKVAELLQNDPDVGAIADRKRQLAFALRIAKAEMPKAKPHKKVPKEGKHQRSTGRETDDLRSDEERMKADLETMSDEEFLKAWVMPGAS